MRGGVAMGYLDDEVAIITGAAQGMGAMHVRKFVEEGAKVVVSDIDEAAGTALADELGERATFMRLDVSKEEDWSRVVEAAESGLGPVTVLVNNAGVGIFKLLEELTVEDFRFTFEIDELGVFLGMKTVVPSMKRAGHGSIVNISSVSGLRGAPTGVAYCSSKHAVTGMTKAAASELGQFNIRVNSLHPGTVETALSGQGDVADYVDELKKTIPLGRAGGVDEISDLCVYLASDRSSYCTGQQFVADGGMICDL
jgi:3alpha(or 20beta)-hydroxysteroid dehydrogenase